MNKKILALCGIALIGPFGVAQAEDPTLSPSIVYGGIINFSGQVVNAACAVDSSSTNLDVPMGQVRIAQIDKGVNTMSYDRKSFSIILGDCDPSVSSNASVLFNGRVDDSDTTGTVPAGTAILAGGENGASNGVALQIFDMKDKLVVVDNLTRSSPINLIPDKNIIEFSVGWVSLVAQGLVKSGDASGKVDFSMNYF